MQYRPDAGHGGVECHQDRGAIGRDLDGRTVISLLIAATIWAAPPRPVLFTATTGGHSSRHMGNRHYVSVIQRAAVGRPPWRPEWFAPSNIGYRSFTLSVTGADYSLTTPDFRWAIAECSYG